MPIEDPASIQEVFDVISYRKGSSVLRMLHDWVGDVKFRDGLRLYLSRHKYSNTCTRDLWAALEQKSGLPVGRVMSTWTKQKGFPLITVSESQRSDGKAYLTLAQKKFSANSTISVLERRIRWEIPVTFITETSPSGETDELKQMFTERFRPVEVPIKSRDEWIKLNSKSIGFYRTQYPDEMLALLVPAVQSKKLDKVERLQLQSDLFALARAGYDDTVKFLNFLRGYRNETDYFVWDSITDSLGSIYTLLSNTDFLNKFEAFGIETLSTIYDQISWDAREGESPSDSLLRSLVINNLGLFKYDRVVAEAKRRFAEQQREGGTPIPADLRGGIYRTVVRSASDEEFAQFFDMYRRADSSAEKTRIGSALGATTDDDRIKQVLNFSLSSDVRGQDAPGVMTSVTGSKRGRELAWEFFVANKEEIGARYSNDYLIGRVIKGIIGGHASEERATEFEQFFKKNDFPGSARAVSKCVLCMKSFNLLSQTNNILN